jgi:hypothetical protein
VRWGGLLAAAAWNLLTWRWGCRRARSSELELRGALARRQDHWRRCSRMGETAVDVAERRVYAILKEN